MKLIKQQGQLHVMTNREYTIAMKKAILWTFLTAFFLIGALYMLRGPIVTLACRQVLLPYLPKAQFSLRDFNWKNGKCLIKDFVISSKEKEWVKVERVECDLNVQWNPVRIRPKIALSGVEIQASNGLNGKGSLESVRKTLAKQQVVDLVIAHGVVHFDQETPDLTFSFEPSSLKGHLGTIRLDNESMMIDLFARHKDVYTKVFLSNTNIASVSKIINYFSLEWPWKVHAGELSGSFELGIHRKKMIDHLRFSLRASDISGEGFSADEISLGMHLPFESTGRVGARELNVSNFFSQFITMAEVKKGSFSFTNGTTGKKWKLDRFDGSLDGREKRLPAFKGAGIVVFDDVGLPIELNACGEVGDDMHCSMGIDFLHKAEGGHAELGVTLGGRAWQFFCDLKELSGIELSMVQDLANHFIPLPFHLEGGIISGECQGIWENGKVLAVDVRSFDMRGINGLYGANRFWVEQVRGKGTYHHTVPVVVDAIIRGAALQTAFGEMGSMTGSLCTEGGRIHNTTIWGDWQGVDYDATLEGTFKLAKLQAHFTLPEEFPFKKHWETAKKHYPDLEPIREFVTSLTLEDLHNGWQAEGSFLLAYADQLTDKMHFRFVAAGDHLRDVLAKKEVSGAFWGREVSHHIFGIPLGLGQQPWQLRGTVDVDGDFDERGLELRIHPGNLAFESPDLDLSMELAEKPSVLRWDFNCAAWNGKVYVSGARGVQKQYALPFENISGTMTLSSNILEVCDVDVVCEGVNLGGYLTYDFADPLDPELQMSIDRIDGDSKDVQRLLRHFDEMGSLDIPVAGRVIHEKSSWITVKRGELECAFYTHLKEGSVALSEGISAQDLSFNLEWDSRAKVIEIKEFGGKLALEGDRSYALSSRYFRCVDVESLLWEFDLRAATSTYDVLRLMGKGVREGNQLHFAFDKEYSHFYRGKLDIDRFTMNLDFEPLFLSFTTQMGVADFAFALDFLGQGKVIPMKSGMVDAFQSAHLKGNIEVDMQIDVPKGDLACELTGIDVPLRLSFDKRAGRIEVKEFMLDAIEGYALIQEEEAHWVIPTMHAKYGNSTLDLKRGEFLPDAKTVKLELEKACVDMDSLKTLFNIEEFTHLAGIADLTGTAVVDYSQGWDIEAELSLFCNSFGQGKTKVQSRSPFTLSMQANKEVAISGAKFKCWEGEQEEIWGEVDASKLVLKLEDTAIVGSGIKVVLPPELTLHFATHGFLPNLHVEEEALHISGIPLQWENQIISEFDFSYIGNVFKAHGLLQEGYYWLGDRSWLLKDFAFNFYGDRLRLTSQVQFADFTFDLSSVVSFGTDITGQVSISECPQKPEARPLALFFRWNEGQGLTLQGAEGTLHGLSFDFHHNPRVYLPRQMILSGSVGVDSVALMEIFPQEVKHRLKQLGIGKGYELSGDLILSMGDLKESRFKGYLKGRDFELIGCQLKTLLSEIEMHRSQVTLRDFRLSDDGGVFLAKEIRTVLGENDEWKMTIPEVVVQDFRPSLIKEVGTPRGTLRPFVVKDLHFCNIEGTVGKPETFTGRGYLDFYNTFKRDFHFLDIPFDIIGRLGLDLNLFVPVKGKVDYLMQEGKIFLTGLKESYSDGERSQFYFPESKENYIGLDGSLQIDMKMKQYVLLKITEPFTLSVRGTLMKPRYSLK